MRFGGEGTSSPKTGSQTILTRRAAAPIQPPRDKGRHRVDVLEASDSRREASFVRILISDDLSPESKTILERIPGAQVDFKVGLKPAELREIIAGAPPPAAPPAPPRPT